MADFYGGVENPQSPSLLTQFLTALAGYAKGKDALAQEERQKDFQLELLRRNQEFQTLSNQEKAIRDALGLQEQVLLDASSVPNQTPDDQKLWSEQLNGLKSLKGLAGKELIDAYQNYASQGNTVAALQKAANLKLQLAMGQQLLPYFRDMAANTQLTPASRSLAAKQLMNIAQGAPIDFNAFANAKIETFDPRAFMQASGVEQARRLVQGGYAVKNADGSYTLSPEGIKDLQAKGLLDEQGKSLGWAPDWTGYQREEQYNDLKNKVLSLQADNLDATNKNLLLEGKRLLTELDTLPQKNQAQLDLLKTQIDTMAQQLSENKDLAPLRQALLAGQARITGAQANVAEGTVQSNIDTAKANAQVAQNAAEMSNLQLAFEQKTQDAKTKAALAEYEYKAALNNSEMDYLRQKYFTQGVTALYDLSKATKGNMAILQQAIDEFGDGLSPEARADLLASAAQDRWLASSPNREQSFNMVMSQAKVPPADPATRNGMLNSFRKILSDPKNGFTNDQVIAILNGIKSNWQAYDQAKTEQEKKLTADLAESAAKTALMKAQASNIPEQNKIDWARVNIAQGQLNLSAEELKLRRDQMNADLALRYAQFNLEKEKLNQKANPGEQVLSSLDKQGKDVNQAINQIKDLLLQKYPGIASAGKGALDTTANPDILKDPLYQQLLSYQNLQNEIITQRAFVTKAMTGVDLPVSPLPGPPATATGQALQIYNLLEKETKVPANVFKVIGAIETGHGRTIGQSQSSGGVLGVPSAIVGKNNAGGVAPDEYVDKYVIPYLSSNSAVLGSLSPNSTIADLYMAWKFPSVVGRGDGYVLYKKGSAAYNNNAALDQSGKGFVTVADIKSYINQRLANTDLGQLGATADTRLGQLDPNWKGGVLLPGASTPSTSTSSTVPQSAPNAGKPVFMPTLPFPFGPR